MRRSFDTLSRVVHQEMARTVVEGDLFLFVSRDRKRAKVLYFDGTGICLFAKRMSRAQFPAPWKMKRETLTLSELALFIEGAEAVRSQLSPAVLRKVDLKISSPSTEELVENAINC
jgi:transposase